MHGRLPELCKMIVLIVGGGGVDDDVGGGRVLRGGLWVGRGP